jgi:acyl-CoA thioester hydrolase
MLSIIHEARVRLFRSLGFEELNVNGVGIIMTDAEIQFKLQGFYGEILIIEIAVTEFTSIGCDFVYRVTNKNTKKEIALAKTGIVFFDYEKQKTAPVPIEFRKKIESFI